MATLSSVPCAASHGRPTPPRIAAVPYDVVNTDEARALADGNPLSFLRVSRAEIELPPGHRSVLRRGLRARRARTSTRSKRGRSSSKTSRACTSTGCGWAQHEQTGLAACFSLDEYDRDVIKKHERTRRDKEDDRTRHMLALGAQTGPVFLTYRASADVDRSSARASTAASRSSTSTRPTACGTRSGASPAPSATRSSRRFARIPRSTSPTAITAPRAPRARAPRCASARLPGTSLGDGADARHVAGRGVSARPGADPPVQPHRQGSRRAVARRVSRRGARAVRRRARAGDAGAARRDRDVFRRRVAHAAAARARRTRRIAIASLDVSVLQDQLLAPVLQHRRRAHRQAHRFRRRRARHRASSSGWSTRARRRWRSRCIPVSVADLMAVSDAGAIMPPKSTWFEPKLRDGLLIHVI